MNLSFKNYSVRGLLIILVVFGHVLSKNPLFEGRSFLYLFIYSFHMPLFMILSGYYGYSAVHKSNYVIFKTTITSLIIPFVIASSLYRAENVLIHGGSFNPHIFENPSFAMWFILAIAFYRLITKLVVKIPHYLLLTFIISIIYPYLPESILSYAGSVRIFAFSFYFFLGIYLRENEVNLKKFNLNLSGKLIIGAILVVIISFLANFGYQLTGTFFRHDNFEYLRGIEVYYYIPLQISFLFLSLLSCFYIYCLVPPVDFLAKIGPKSFNIYLVHIFFIALLKADVYKQAIENVALYYILPIAVLETIGIIGIILLLTDFYDNLKDMIFHKN